MSYILTPTHSDDFQRADENPLSDGGKWAVGMAATSLPKLVSHLAEPTATSVSCVALWTGDGAWANDQYSEITVNTVASTGFSAAVALVRASTTAQTGYRAYVNGALGASAKVIVDKYVATVNTQLIPPITTTVNLGDRIAIAAVGNFISVFVNGVLLASTWDSSIASGYAGLAVYSQTSITFAQISSWTGGTAANAVTSPFILVQEIDNLASPVTGQPTLTTPQAVTKGNLLVAWVKSASANLTSGKWQILADDHNFWVPIYGTANNSNSLFGKQATSSTYTISAWYCIAQRTEVLSIKFFNATSTSGAGPVPSGSYGSAPANLTTCSCQLAEFSGNSLGPSVGRNYATGTGTLSIGSVSAPRDGSLIIAVGTAGSGNTTIGTGADPTGGAHPNSSFEYLTGLDSGTYYMNQGISSSSVWQILTASFEPSTATLYTLSGALGAAGAGALVAVISETTCYPRYCTADSSGNYSLSGLSNDTYYVVPQLVGQLFTANTVTVSGSNATLNFTATPCNPNFILTTLGSDTFHRADMLTTTGITQTGVWQGDGPNDGTTIPPWDPVSALSNNEAVLNPNFGVVDNYTGPWSQGALPSYVPATAWTTDQWMQVQIDALSSTCLSYANTAINNYVRAAIFNLGNGTAAVRSTNLKTFTPSPGGNLKCPNPSGGIYLITPSLCYLEVTFALGDVFAVASIGTTRYVLQNGKVIANWVDAAAVISTYLGFWEYGNAPTDVEISNFAGGSVAQAFAISGNVGIAGATVAYTGTSSGSVISDALGNYTIPNLANGSYTITPSKSTVTFTPTSSNQTVSSALITGVNFTASANQSSMQQGSSGGGQNMTGSGAQICG